MSLGDPRIGTTLKDKWRIDALLGRGGMASVYAATHRNGKRVAVKILNPELTAIPEIRARFLREGYVANKVGHRGAVSVDDDDVAPDGAAFLVMELLDGETLEARRERSPGGRLPAHEVAALVEVAVRLLRVLACSVVPAALLLAAPRAARAQGAAAEALFDQGRAALAAGDLDTACARFRGSDQIEPAAGTRGNLADCEQRRGKVATAWAVYKSALAMLPSADPRVAVVQERIKALEARLPKLVLTLAPAAPKETTVREGEVTIGSSATFGVPLPLDPGVHHLTVLAPGLAPSLLDVSLAEGKTTTVVVEAGAPEGSPRPVEAPAGGKPVEQQASPGPWIVGGIGAAGLVVGIATGAVVLQKKAATSGCTDGPPPTCPTQAGVDAANLGRTLGPVTTVSLVIGAAGVAAGGLWLGLGRTSSVGVAPVPGGVAWRVEGAW